MQGEKMVLHMGPSHPSTHGVLRILPELDGELITKAPPDPAPPPRRAPATPRINPTFVSKPSLMPNTTARVAPPLMSR